MDEVDTEKPLTLGTVFKDFFSVPFFLAAFIGGTSMFSIIESVTMHHDLIPVFQWVLDGYHRCMVVVGAVVEPIALAIADKMHMHIQINPTWRPLFAITLSIPLASIKSTKSLNKMVWIKNYVLQYFCIVILLIFYLLVFGILPLFNAFFTGQCAIAFLDCGVVVSACIFIVLGIRSRHLFYLRFGIYLASGLFVS